MPSKLNPYISFNGNAQNAMEFYQTVLGGNLTKSTFKEGGAQVGPEFESKLMHAALSTDNGMTIMAADTPPGMPYSHGTDISISLSGDDEAQLRGYWEKLTGGATIAVPLDKAPWGDTFGMLTDKFGIGWLVNISGKK